MDFTCLYVCISCYHNFPSNSIFSVFLDFLECLLNKKKPTDKQIAAVITISKANAVLNPVSASLTESLIPRKLILLITVIGSLVTTEKDKYIFLLTIFNRPLTVKYFQTL